MQLLRAIRTLSEPAATVNKDVLLDQISKSMVAEERLLALDAKSREAAARIAQEKRGGGPERNMRDQRVVASA